MKAQWLICAVAVYFGATGVAAGEGGAKDEAFTIKIESAKIQHGESIPVDYTADGKDVSPALKWADVPEDTQELALICDDPDAPTPKPWVHWVIYNIPPGMTSLPEGLPSDKTLEKPAHLAGVQHGLNGWRKPGYRGPAPPPGKVHHYHFVLYALDEDLDLEPGLSKEALLEAMEGHVLAKGKLTGTYKR